MRAGVTHFPKPTLVENGKRKKKKKKKIVSNKSTYFQLRDSSPPFPQ